MFVLTPDCSTNISIHALREEGDHRCKPAIQLPVQFLSTPSARRATDDVSQPAPLVTFLSTHSARRATRKMQRFS